MKLRVITPQKAGGVFSHFTIAIQQIERCIDDIDSIESIYIEPSVESIIGQAAKQNPFSFVLDQDDRIFDVKLQCPVRLPYTNHSDIPQSKLDRFRKICRKLTVKQSLLEKVDKNITEKVYGVHVRTTDMFFCHPQHSSYKYISTEDFINKTLEVAGTENPIFVASDNVISIMKFKEKFNVISNECFNRSATEQDKDYTAYQITNLGKECFWEYYFWK